MCYDGYILNYVGRIVLKIVSIVFKVIATLIGIEQMIFIGVGIVGDAQSINNGGSGIALTFLIFLEILFLIILLAQIISTYIKRVSVKQEIAVFIALFILGIILFAMHAATLMLLVAVILTGLLSIIIKQIDYNIL